MANSDSIGSISKLCYFSLLNIQGLKPSTRPSCVPYVADLLHDKDQLFICLTETWLHDHVTAELTIKGYTSYRADRDYSKRHSGKCKGRFSGGVACYIKDDFAASMEELLSFSNGVIEVLVLYSKVNNILIIALYRQPDDVVNGHRSTSRELAECISKVKDILLNIDTPEPNIILLGDFNLPSVDWVKLSCSGSKCVKDCFLVLQEFLDKYGLVQYISKPTHRQGNTLDLVFLNNDLLIHSYEVNDVLQSISHHSIIQLASTIGLKSSKQTEPDKQDLTSSLKKFNFHSEDIDWEKMNKDFQSIDWEDKFFQDDISMNKISDVFLETLFSVFENSNVPLKPSVSRNKHKIPVHRKRLINNRRRVQKRLNSSKLSPGVKEKLKAKLYVIEETLMNSYSQQKRYEEKRAIEAIKRNPKFFYSFADKHSKSPSKIGPLIHPESGGLVNDNEGMANILADQFSSVFSTPLTVLEPADVLFPANEQLPFSDFELSVDDFLDAMADIKANSGSGPKGVPAILLKKCPSLAVPLHLMWSKSFDEGIVPMSMKETVVSPLHKAESRGLPINYRPITNSSHIIKVFERVISKKLVHYLEQNFLFNPNQHGFRKGRSCLSELLSHFYEILSIVESGGRADVVYLDFSKAFDKVDFYVLMQKLRSLGIGGKVGRWIYSFLVGRQHRVAVNGALSTLRDILSGVPQGSVLGPLLFLILISDIDKNVVHSSLRSFADDSRMTKAIFSPSDVNNFQHDVNSVYSWANQNNMFFNETKFELLTYSTNSSTSASTEYVTYSGHVIEESSDVTDLGVTMSNTCLFDSHMDEVVKKMKSKSSWILRTFSSRSRLCLLTTWKTLVLPLHDYCSQLWSPHKIKDISVLEKVQWDFIGRIYGVSDNYWTALKELNLFSLQRRRERYMVFYIWKVLEQFVPSILDSSGFPVLMDNITSRKGRMCSVPSFARTKSSVQTIKDYSFFVHGAKLFNTMPQKVRDITNCKFEVFKTAVDSFLRNVKDEPHLNGYNFRSNGVISNSLLDII